MKVDQKFAKFAPLESPFCCISAKFLGSMQAKSEHRPALSVYQW